MRPELHCGHWNAASGRRWGEQNSPSDGHARRFCAQVCFHPPPSRVPRPPPSLGGGASGTQHSAGGKVALTYARARLHGVAGEEADLLRRQDFALQPQGDDGVRCVRPKRCARPLIQGQLAGRKQIDSQFTSPGYPLPEWWLAGRRKNFCPPSLFPSFLDGDC